MGDISERTARKLKADLPAAIEQITARSEQGEPPAKSAKETAAERKAAKEKAKAEKQAQHDRECEEHRARMPDAVKVMQAAKQAAIEARKAKPDEVLSNAG